MEKKNDNKQIRCCIYARVSTDKQKAGVQLSELRQFVKRAGGSYAFLCRRLDSSVLVGV